MGVDILVLQHIRHLELAFALIVLGLEVENRTILDLPAWVRALVNGLLQDTRFPALHEVTVVTKSSGVAVGQNELAIVVLEFLGVPDGLVEEGDQAMLVSLRAGTVHDEGGIGDVRFVILRVDILAIPAGGEHDLKAKTVRTEEVQEGLLWQIVTVQGSLSGLVVVQAIETNGLLAQGSLRALITEPERLGGIGDRPGKVALEGIASEHTEVRREGLDVLSIKKIVTVPVRSVNRNQGATYASMPPASVANSAVPLECKKYRAGCQYAERSCLTAHEVQSPACSEASSAFMAKLLDP